MGQFESWSAFWHMGGYALYVWLAFGLGFGLMLATTLAVRHNKKRLLQQVLHEAQRQARIKQSKER